MENPIKTILFNNGDNERKGIYSACSANKYVIQAVLERAKETNSVALIEATANQCDQFGGYTGMKPKDFYNFVMNEAIKIGLPHNMIILGGDHLGPLTWSHLDSKEAMENAKELVKQYVLAGFKKIHLDTSMKLKDDAVDEPLSNSIIADRGAILAEVVKETYSLLKKDNKDEIKPCLVIGSEVPIPGGATGEENEGMRVTKVDDLHNTVAAYQTSFKNKKIEDMLDEVVAIVVQPGIEEKDAGCVEYDRNKAKDLVNGLKEYKNLVFEGHSSDYQTKYKLRELVEDDVAILKVGPGLSFAYREALFALSYIEDVLFQDSEKKSNLVNVIEKVMISDNGKWKNYYFGTDHEISIKRKFSFSDRIRYYLVHEDVQKAIDTLFKNLSDNEIPLNLLSQFLPIQYTKVREGKITNDPESLIKDRIKNTIDEYLFATIQLTY